MTDVTLYKNGATVEVIRDSLVPPVVEPEPPIVIPPPTGGDTALATAAAALLPGQWAELAAIDLDLTMSGRSNPEICFPYTNSMPWDRLNRKIVFVGASHSEPPQHTEYSDATNTWKFIESSYGSHGFQHMAVNPVTGDQYQWNTGGLIKFENGSWTNMGVFPYLDNQCVTAALTWWPGTFQGGGAQGTLFCFSGRGGTLTGYDPLTAQHFYQNASASPAISNAYHVVSAYSAKKNCMVFGGGNDSGGTMHKELYRLNADRSITRLADPPFNVGIHNGMIFTVDPVSGNFLLYGFDQFWELNSDGAGTYRQLATTPLLAMPGATTGNGVIAVPCSTYGVVIYIDGRYNRSPKCKQWVYKHA